MLIAMKFIFLIIMIMNSFLLEIEFTLCTTQVDWITITTSADCWMHISTRVALLI